MQGVKSWTLGMFYCSLVALGVGLAALPTVLVHFFVHGSKHASWNWTIATGFITGAFIFVNIVALAWGDEVRRKKRQGH